jgi:pectinesterase
VYPDTCIEGLEGSIVKGLISSGLDHVMSLVANLLGEVVSGNDDQLATNKDRFPSWIRDEDTKLLQANGVTADAVVASDGSGDYTKVMDAVSAAPESSMKRFVIYVKKGVYVENVEIKKKKWNIMLIGEGMDATIISGSRNYVDGSTTFRSATFGKNDYIHTPLQY